MRPAFPNLCVPRICKLLYSLGHQQAMTPACVPFLGSAGRCPPYFSCWGVCLGCQHPPSSQGFHLPRDGSGVSILGTTDFCGDSAHGCYQKSGQTGFCKCISSLPQPWATTGDFRVVGGHLGSERTLRAPLSCLA